MLSYQLPERKKKINCFPYHDNLTHSDHVLQMITWHFPVLDTAELLNTNSHMTITYHMKRNLIPNYFNFKKMCVLLDPCCSQRKFYIPYYETPLLGIGGLFKEFWMCLIENWHVKTKLKAALVKCHCAIVSLVRETFCLFLGHCLSPNSRTYFIGHRKWRFLNGLLHWL